MDLWCTSEGVSECLSIKRFLKLTRLIGVKALVYTSKHSLNDIILKIPRSDLSFPRNIGLECCSEPAPQI